MDEHNSNIKIFVLQPSDECSILYANKKNIIRIASYRILFRLMRKCIEMGSFRLTAHLKQKNKN